MTGIIVGRTQVETNSLQCVYADRRLCLFGFKEPARLGLAFPSDDRNVTVRANNNQMGGSVDLIESFSLLNMSI